MPLQAQPAVAAPADVGARLTALSLAFAALVAGQAVNLGGLPAALTTVIEWARSRAPAGVDDGLAWRVQGYAAAGSATLVCRSTAHELIISLDADGAPCLVLWRSLLPGAENRCGCFQFELGSEGAELLFEVAGEPQRQALPQATGLPWGSLTGFVQQLARVAAPEPVPVPERAPPPKAEAPGKAVPLPGPAAFCEQCGHGLGPQARFCGQCGAQVPRDSAGATSH